MGFLHDNFTTIITIVIIVVIMIPFAMKFFGTKSTEELVEKERQKHQRLAEIKKRESGSTQHYDEVVEYRITSGKKK
ncbi:MAG: hypothetical protein M1269_01840 [Chloroflexi bacterium]|nr:hypothetical protein [Chloroflexota bacterium]